jgi:hypothetical protein
MFGNLFKTKSKNSKLQSAEEYWQEQKNKNRQKAAILGMDYNKELSESSFLDQGNKYKITFKGM